MYFPVYTLILIAVLILLGMLLGRGGWMHLMISGSVVVLCCVVGLIVLWAANLLAYIWRPLALIPILAALCLTVILVAAGIRGVRDGTMPIDSWYSGESPDGPVDYYSRLCFLTVPVIFVVVYGIVTNNF